MNHDADSLAGIELAFQIDRRPLQEHQRMSRDLTDWDETQPHEFGTFGDIQPLCSTGRTFSSSVFEQRLIELAGKTGRLLDDVAANRVEHNRDVLTGHLVEIFRALVSAADEVNVNLGSGRSPQRCKDHQSMAKFRAAALSSAFRGP